VKKFKLIAIKLKPELETENGEKKIRTKQIRDLGNKDQEGRGIPLK
jgi:hypothetical protein